MPTLRVSSAAQGCGDGGWSREDTNLQHVLALGAAPLQSRPGLQTFFVRQLRRDRDLVFPRDGCDHGSSIIKESIDFKEKMQSWRSGGNRDAEVSNPCRIDLGAHVVLGLDGGVRLGPNALYVEAVDYQVDLDHRDAFHAEASKPEDLSPDQAGSRRA